jgi:hypothetical protein
MTKEPWHDSEAFEAGALAALDYITDEKIGADVLALSEKTV